VIYLIDLYCGMFLHLLAMLNDMKSLEIIQVIIIYVLV